MPTWIKASERLPDKSHNYFVKVWSGQHQYIYHDTNYFDKGWSVIRNTSDCVEEWLDESSPDTSFAEGLLEWMLEDTWHPEYTGDVPKWCNWINNDVIDSKQLITEYIKSLEK